jgi:hypothetical protein
MVLTNSVANFNELKKCGKIYDLLPPASPKTIHQKEIKIGMVDKVYEFYKCAKFQLAIFRGSAPHIREI